jgi:hypothetical protein
MDTPRDTPQPDPPPPVISDEDVDRLLRQAEDLAQTIVEDVGVERIHTSAHTAQLGGPEPNPLSAVELVAHDLAELKATIEEVSPQIEQALTRALEEPVRKEEPTAQERNKNQTIEAPAKTEKPEPAASAPPPAMSPADEKKNEAPTEPVASDPEAPQPAQVAPSAEASPVTETPIAPQRTRSMVRAAAMFLPNMLTSVFVLLDRPFAGMPASTKNLIGAVGVASLVTGAAALFMPRIMQSNPYATMEPLPHPELAAEAAPSEHAASHEAEEKPHEEKPAEHGGGHH